jgi:hypothetical protein
VSACLYATRERFTRGAVAIISHSVRGGVGIWRAPGPWLHKMQASSGHSHQRRSRALSANLESLHPPIHPSIALGNVIRPIDLRYTPRGIKGRAQEEQSGAGTRHVRVRTHAPPQAHVTLEMRLGAGN